jgi:hypothetical protein
VASLTWECWIRQRKADVLLAREKPEEATVPGVSTKATWQSWSSYSITWDKPTLLLYFLLARRCWDQWPWGSWGMPAYGGICTPLGVGMVVMKEGQSHVVQAAVLTATTFSPPRGDISDFICISFQSFPHGYTWCKILLIDFLKICGMNKAL